MCKQLDLQTLGPQPVVSKNLPDHWREREVCHLYFQFSRVIGGVYENM